MIEFTPIFITGIIFLSITFVIKVISDNRIRTRLIESGKIDEKLQFLYMHPGKKESHPLSSLKWGLVLVALGLALFVGQFLPYEMEGEGTIGTMFLFSGIAFLIYYFVSKNERKEENLSE
jgi:uncharacterized protein DUF6249